MSVKFQKSNVHYLIMFSRPESKYTSHLMNFLSIGILCLSILSACDDPSVAQVDKSELEKLEQDIRAEIGEAKAAEASQCKLIAFGSKPCGGPWEYLVYSTSGTDEEKLKEMVERYNLLEKKYNEENDIVSDCMLVAEPEVALVNGLCTKAK